jgi:catechol 2,3-dioxygenase-like lactoylglutathione lyase family enzyme
LSVLGTIEAQQASPTGIEERFRQLDRNRDGKLTPDELPGQWFERLDTSKDGMVTAEEAKAALLGGARRRAKAGGLSPFSLQPAKASALGEWAAVFDLCARDVEAEARFFCNGIGMRRVEIANAGEAVLLEWRGTYLRLRRVQGNGAVPPTGHPVQQMIASNGFRWFSLWLGDPAVVERQLTAAGYGKPIQSRNVSFIRDPEGNVVELMRLPSGVSEETFTVGMVVQDEAACRAFYGSTLGLLDNGSFRLPPPLSRNMWVYRVGKGKLKFVAPDGKRANDAELGPDAPGIRALTLWVPDLAKARETLVQRGAKPQDTGDRLLVTDPDSNRIFVEKAPAWVPPPKGSGSPTATAGEEAWPGGPRLKIMPPGDASADAAGRGQLFESLHVPGFTDIGEGTNGIAIADLNRDGLLDIVATYSPPRGQGGAWSMGEKLRVFLNEGDFRFREHPIKLLDSPVTPEAFARGQVPVLADFNKDGFLDLFVTRHAPAQAGQVRPGATAVGNSLYVSDGAWDRFRDLSERMGIRNELAYNRQPCLGDVNRDGWLDIAIGCDNIGNAMGGVPHSRLYVFRPNGQRFEDGKFEDIGGTELVPDFGGFYHDCAKDKAGPDINLCDLDNDGDLDLLQSYHCDVRAPLLPYSPGEYRQGVFCWKNLLCETGQLKFEKITDNGLACEAKLNYNREKQIYEATGRAPGLPYISLADVDNDGMLDVLAVGPADPSWAPRAEYVHGRFWRNLGNFRFQEATEQVGLHPINWKYRQWYSFWEAPIPERFVNWRPRVAAYPSQPGFPPQNPLDAHGFYAADALFGDFDNDGWVDLVVLDRSESDPQAYRAMLFMNKGDGTFELKPTTFSGLDASGICGQVADLNNDGLLDLVFAADPDNSTLATTPDRYEDKVYWNAGLHGARQNHWLRLRFSGVSDAELIGARVEVRQVGDDKLLGMRAIVANDSYKSGCPLEVHFGLGHHERVNLTVTLLNGKTAAFANTEADQYLECNLATRSVTRISGLRAERGAMLSHL